MVGCRVNLKENLKQSVSPTTVIFNGMRSRRMFMNGFSYPKCGEDVLQTKQVFVYAKFSIWGCHFKRFWLWWQKILPLMLLIPTLVSELPVSLLAAIRAVPRAVLSAQRREERQELCCERRTFWNRLCPRYLLLVTPGRLHVLHTHKYSFWTAVFSGCVLCLVVFPLQRRNLQSVHCHSSGFSLSSESNAVDASRVCLLTWDWLLFYAFEEEMFAFCIFKSFFLKAF